MIANSLNLLAAAEAKQKYVTISGETVSPLLMIALGVLSIILRRLLVRWHAILFWGRPLPAKSKSGRELLQLAIGIVLVVFGLVFSIFSHAAVR